MRHLLAAMAAIVLVGFASTSQGYSYESPVGEGCHERLTLNALQLLREEQQTTGSILTTEDDLTLLRELPFYLPQNSYDIAAAALLFGVRDNDVKGFSGIDSNALPHVHARADNQKEHCLRRLEHEEPDGSELALNECRSYIAKRLRLAAEEGVDEAGEPDSKRRTGLDTYLSFSGRVTVSLPTFYLRLGQGLHALQDSFTHAYRTADHMRIHTILNWVDEIDERVEARDGPAHLSAMDLCSDLEAFRQERYNMAAKATYDLVQAMFVPVDGLQERGEYVGDVLNRYMSFEPGCGYDNGWCNAPERAFVPSMCSLGSLPRRGFKGGVLFLLIAVGVWRRRRV